MSYQDVLKKIIEENSGYLDVNLAKKFEVSSSNITAFKRKNNLIKVAHGLYKTEDTWDDELYVISKVNSRVIFSNETALYLHGLMDREPFEVSVTVYSGYNASHLRKQGIKVYQINKKLYTIGQSSIGTAFNHKVKVYDLERSMCDVVKNREKIDIQIYSTAWKLYLKRDDKDIPKLMEYAKKFGIEDIMRMYMEVVSL